MRKKTIIYCVYCGTKNSIHDKRCKKCKKKLNPKDHSFFDFLLENGKNDLKDYVTDGVFDYLKSFFVEHLYGTVLVVSVIFSTTSIILQALPNHDITYVNRVVAEEKYEDLEKDAPKEESTKQVETKEVIQATKVCDAFYTLQNDQCIYHNEVAANVHYSCSDTSYQYYASVGKCLLFAVAGKAGNVCDVTQEARSQYNSTLTHVDKNTGKCILSYQEDGVQKEVEIDSPVYKVVLCNAGSNYKFDDNCYYNQDPLVNYSCSSGSLSGDMCITNQVKKYHYDCQEGYHLINHNQCEKDG